jgi:DNA-binding transcriptional regulator YiaG
MNDNIQYADVTVRIPNLDGDGIAETHTVKVPVTIDPHTGEQMLTEEAIELIETTKARYMGLLLAPEIKKMRERLGFSQKRISEIFQSGEKSWTRWETGRTRPSRMVNVLLRLVYEGKVFVSDLIAQRKESVNWRKNFPPRLQRPTVTQVVAQVKVSYENELACSGGGVGIPPPEFSCPNTMFRIACCFNPMFRIGLSNHFFAVNK